MRVAAYLAVWVLVTAVASLALFLNSSRTTTLASHDAVVRPTLTGYAVVHTGPVLPDVRVESGSPLGVDIVLGKTDAPSTEALVQRYAAIAAQPEGPRAKVDSVVRSLAVVSLLRGGVLGLVPIAGWLLLGPARRAELGRRLGSRAGVAALVAAVALGVVAWSPWEVGDDTLVDERDWVPLTAFVGPEIEMPDPLLVVELQGDVTTQGTRRLLESAVNHYGESQEFYADVLARVDELSLRRPADGEVVVALVSDRHDNIGMDPVARAIADAAGAQGVLDAGDDTSSGARWEAFSLDSATAAFDGYDRWAATGNHDHGDFVGSYLAEQGWAVLNGEVVDGPGGSRILGAGDPRSSGLGDWRDETGLSFGEVADRLADAACAADEDGERVATILVHDADLAEPALERGCVDLVVAGHLHVEEGPTRVVGDNGATGFSYTTGTTGGAGYAFALGKIRRTAQVTLLTYRDGRPAGLQAVMLRTDGRFEVGAYQPLEYAE